MKPTEEQIKDWGKRVYALQAPKKHIRGIECYDRWIEYEKTYRGVTFGYALNTSRVLRLQYVRGDGFHCPVMIYTDSPVWDRMEELISSIEEDEKEAKFQKEAEIEFLRQEAEKAALASMEEIIGRK